MDDDVAEDKRTEQIKLLVSERVALDLLRVATLDDRHVADWIHRLVLRELYGQLAAADRLTQRTRRD